MNRADSQALLALPIILAVGAAVAFAGADGSRLFAGQPAFLWCAVLAFGINWLVFVPSFLTRTERFFDLTGSLTYLSTVAFALFVVGDPTPRSLLLGGLIALWAGRLGIFLFRRVSRDGEDRRFREIKQSFPRFLMAWTLQGLWVLLGAGCALTAMTSSHEAPLGVFAAVGTALWVGGFVVEAVADRQKTAFNADPEKRGTFIHSGLWAWSRHPNYFGEIVLWFGIAVIAFPVLQGWQYALLISPLFVYVLLTRISGVPLLEARGRKKFGHLEEYQQYVERTPALWPRPPRRA
ncbi:MAG: DUF1295 domain-containing protein [Acidobacteriota bacterium]